MSRGQLKKGILIRNFFRSPRTISLLGINILIALTVMLTTSVPVLVVLSLFVVISGGEMAALLTSKSGAKAILAEQDRERNEQDAEKLSNAAALRKRLALLRIDDPALKASIDKIVVASGLYLDSCAKGGIRDPIVENALEQTVNAVNAYLRVSDGDLIERRFNAQDESTATTSLTARTRDLIEKYVEEMADRLALPQGGLEGNHTALDALESREELEE